MAHLVDSSVLVALFLDFDTQHAKAQRLWESLHGDILLPYCIATETATVLCYKHSKEQANQFLTFLDDTRDVTVIDGDIRAEMDFYRHSVARISFADAVLLFLARTRAAQLVTFDDQLERLWRAG
ncbi:MAG: hypothetical protein A3H42_01890 [Deltaproteobacteria bacterium RIFCSPLOWO2_02_FULL_46_8]|nr:MAG: hypothetical protein A3H42_01890 [Deltaproteobacteria bacterium RIFCSPLOWO2_02_FULL_46_8]